MRAAEPFDLAHLELRNRLVGTAHGRGILEDGLPLPEDAEYWRRRAAGGAAMLTVGGTVVAPESTWRRQDHDRGVAPRGGAGDGRARGGDPRRGRGRGVPARAPRPRDDRRRAVVPPGGPVGGALAARAHAPAPADAPASSTRSSRASASRRSTRPRRGSRSSSCTPRTATCSPSSCRRRRTAGPERSSGRLAIVARIVREIRSSAPEVVVGIRLSIGERGRSDAPELLPHVTRSSTT